MAFLDAIFGLVRSILLLDIFLWLYGLILCFAIVCAAFSIFKFRR